MNGVRFLTLLGAVTLALACSDGVLPESVEPRRQASLSSANETLEVINAVLVHLASHEMQPNMESGEGLFIRSGLGVSLQTPEKSSVAMKLPDDWIKEAKGSALIAGACENCEPETGQMLSAFSVPQFDPDGRAQVSVYLKRVRPSWASRHPGKSWTERERQEMSWAFKNDLYISRFHYTLERQQDRWVVLVAKLVYSAHGQL